MAVLFFEHGAEPRLKIERCANRWQPAIREKQRTHKGVQSIG
jgi:hypothetical protein